MPENRTTRATRSRQNASTPDHERPLPIFRRTTDGPFRNDTPAIYHHGDASHGDSPRHATAQDTTASQRDHVPVAPAYASSHSLRLDPMPHAPIPTPRYPDADDYLRQQLSLPPGKPVNLWSLPDPPSGEKPSQPLPVLIKLAIHGSDRQKLTLQEIYKALEDRFAWFTIHRKEQAWKNSIRHNLSLNKVFRNTPRPITEPGKGSYWELDVSEGEGYKRERKRRPKPKSRQGTMDAESDSNTNSCNSDEGTPSAPDSATPAPEDSVIDPQLRSLDASRSISGHGGRYHSHPSDPRRSSPYPTPTPRASSSQGSSSRTQSRTSLNTNPRHSSPDSRASSGTVFEMSNPLARSGPQFGQPSFGLSSFPRPVVGPYSFSSPLPSRGTAQAFAPVRSQSSLSLHLPSIGQPEKNQAAQQVAFDKFGSSPRQAWTAASDDDAMRRSEEAYSDQRPSHAVGHSRSSTFPPDG